MPAQRIRLSRRRNIGFALALWLFVPLFACAHELVFSSIEKTPITFLAESMLSQAYGELGYDIKMVSMPSRRSLNMANSGRVDGELFRIAGIEKAFPNLVPVPYPLMRGRLMAVTLGAGITDWNPQQLSNAVVGVRRGIIVAERAARGLKAIVVNDFDQMLNLLKLGRIDVGLVAEVQGVSSMNAEQRAQLVMLDRPVTEFTLYHYLNNKHHGLVLPLAQVFRRLTGNGEFAAIVEAARDSPGT